MAVGFLMFRMLTISILAVTVAGESNPDCIILQTIIPLECGCEGTEGAAVITCHNKGFTTFPILTNTTNYNKTIAEFTLDRNEISYIPDNAFQGLRIQHLKLTGNPLNNVSAGAFAGLEESLTTLEIGGDKVTERMPPIQAIRNLTNLRELTMKDYKLPNTHLTITFHTFSKLKKLVLDNWNIESVASSVFDGLDVLTSLVITRQLIHSFPAAAISPLINLRQVEVSHCNLTRITDYLFSQFSKLEEINFSNNYISTIEDNSFADITLKVLNLDDNKLHLIDLAPVQYLTALETLQLQNNQIADIPDNPTFLLDKTTLQHLNLARNFISTIHEHTFVNLPKLKSLELTATNIQSFHDKSLLSLPSLERLKLDDFNQGTSLLSLPSMKSLNSLQELYMQNTKVNTSDFWDRVEELPTLRILNLDSTGLDFIKNFTFRNSEHLEELDLTANNISIVKQESFFGLKNSLKILNLQSNNIETLDSCTFHEFNTTLILNLINNPLNCDCRLKWLRSSQLDNDIQLSNFERCKVPFDKKFNNASLSEFVCSITYEEPACTNYYTTPTISTTPPTTLPKIAINVTVVESTQVTITVAWSISAEALGFINGVYIEHEDIQGKGSQGKSNLLPPDGREYKILNLLPGTKYEIFVKAMRNEDQQFVKSVLGDTSGKATLTTTPVVEKKADDQTGIIIGAVVGGVVFLLIVVAILYLLFIRRKTEKESYPVQPRAFKPAELPTMGYDSKRYRRKKKTSDETNEGISVTVISDGQMDNGKHVGRASTGSYQNLNPNSEVSADQNPNKMKHSYVNEPEIKKSNNIYADDVDCRKLPHIPDAQSANKRDDNAGYYNPSFRNSAQIDGHTPHVYHELKM